MPADGAGIGDAEGVSLTGSLRHLIQIGSPRPRSARVLGAPHLQAHGTSGRALRFCLMAYDGRQLFTRLGTRSAHPSAFVIVALYSLAWLVFSRETFGWHAVATIAIWMMTLFIQRAEHRDT